MPSIPAACLASAAKIRVDRAFLVTMERIRDSYLLLAECVISQSAAWIWTGSHREKERESKKNIKSVRQSVESGIWHHVHKASLLTFDAVNDAEGGRSTMNEDTSYCYPELIGPATGLRFHNIHDDEEEDRLGKFCKYK